MIKYRTEAIRRQGYAEYSRQYQIIKVIFVQVEHATSRIAIEKSFPM